MSLLIELTSELIPSSGLTFQGMIRGVIGISSIILISFLYSSNKKNIEWRTISLALFSQLLIGFLILKVPFFQLVFEKAGAMFVKLIDFTREGTIFVFGDLISP